MTDALMPSMRRLASHASAFARNLLAYVEANAWVSYALIFLLNMKILWGIWLYRDLTTGDTSSYFLTAYRWSKQHATDILWSPLYTSFYGEALSLTHDIYAATILHRVAIVLLASVGVLAVMRRLLPPGIALLIAAWWSILPINHDTLYEVVREELGSAYGTGLNGAARVFDFAGKLGLLPGFLAFWISDLSGS